MRKQGLLSTVIATSLILGHLETGHAQIGDSLYVNQFADADSIRQLSPVTEVQLRGDSPLLAFTGLGPRTRALLTAGVQEKKSGKAGFVPQVYMGMAYSVAFGATAWASVMGAAYLMGESSNDHIQAAAFMTATAYSWVGSSIGVCRVGQRYDQERNFWRYPLTLLGSVLGSFAALEISRVTHGHPAGVPVYFMLQSLGGTLGYHLAKELF